MKIHNGCHSSPLSHPRLCVITNSDAARGCFQGAPLIPCSGKTESARRLAKLSDAPFVKVEATKFTEVGYHGRDVDTIVKDLVRERRADERPGEREAGR